MSRIHVKNLLMVLGLAATAGAITASATTTQWWEISGFESFGKGDFEGTVLTSAGEITTGWDTVRRELEEDASVWSYAEGKGGDIYLGTGNRGALYVLKESKLEELTETESVVLTALTFDKAGNLYAAGMPGAEIYRFTPKQISELVKKAAASKGEWKKREYKSDKKGKGKDKDKDKKDKKEEKDKKDEKVAKEKPEGKTPPAAAGKEGPDEAKEGQEGKTDKEKAGEEGKTEKEKAAKTKETPSKGKGKAAKGEEKGKGKGKGKKEAKAEEKKERKGPEPWVKLEEADQVWSLLYDAKRNLLLAGTGPEGKIFSIDSTGRANVYMDTEEDHVFALADMGDGKIAAGTGNSGKLLLVEGAGRGSVLWDFDATEVKSVVRLKPKGGAKAALVCAVDNFKSLPSVSVSKPSFSSLTEAKTPSSSGPGSPEGEGTVAAVFDDGGMRVLFEDKKTHITFMQARGDGGVYFGDGEKGRIFEVDLEGNYAILMDVDERQVLTFCMDCQTPFLGTSDSAALYRVIKQPPATPYYVSDVFDAGFPARWGKMVLRSEGNVAWQARSGNTSEPDLWWTDWSKPRKASDGDITLASGRFMQMRLKVPAGAVVWDARVFYLPANQQAVIKDVTAGDAPDPKKGKEKKSGDKHDPVIELKWTVDNADGDDLLYTLFFAKEGEEIWIPILKEGEELKETKYKWDTTSTPAGYYLIKVVGSDEPANDPKLVLTHSRISKPILVDNDPPQITLNVKAKPDGIVASGKVTDNFSPVSRIEVSVDGKSWKGIFPSDLIYDEPIEDYSYTADGLAPGAHTVTVRAWDEATNLTSTGENVVIKK
jgi:hypothetical protein